LKQSKHKNLSESEQNAFIFFTVVLLVSLNGSYMVFS
jgi:hypothetical protein